MTVQSAISAAGAERLEELLLARARQTAGSGRQGRIPRRPRGRPAPLSFSQRRLWLLDRLGTGSAAYNVPLALFLDGRLDPVALGSALAEVVRRHEVLRSRFPLAGDEPVQVVEPHRRSPPPRVDLSALGDPERDGIGRSLLHRLGRRGFDLARETPLRAVLVRLGGRRHVLALTLHHIACDGWSLGVLVGELAAAYGPFAAGARPSLPPLPLQYADYAAWQRRAGDDDALAADLAFWRRLLPAPPPPLELPADRRRAVARREDGAVASRVLGPELVAAADALGRSCRASRFMVLLAVFAALLGRTTGRSALCVGTPVANRRRAEVQELVGCFVNTLALPLEVDLGRPFAALLEQVRQVVLDAHGHQELPFERLVEELTVERDLSRNPLFQVLFSVDGGRARVAEPAPGLRLTAREVHPGTSKLDLSLSLEEEPGGWRLAAEYATGLFDASTVARLLGHYLRLLAGAVASPQLPPETLTLLSAAEAHQLTVEWRGGAAGRPQRGRADAAAVAAARRLPDAVAVTDGAEHLTYAGLGAASGALARRLAATATADEGVVGIFLERSTASMIALLAVLRAGAAYLPLDPSYPRERLAFLLTDAGAIRVLTRSGLRSALPAGAPSALLVDARGAGGEKAALAAAGTGGDSLAYVLYTSGTSGRPKGVAVSHGALAAHAAAALRRFRLRRGDRVLQLASLSFDVAAEEIFPTWQAGATLVLAGTSPLSPRDLSALAEVRALTVLNLPASFWRQWVGDHHRRQRPLPASLRLVVTGSEAVAPAAVRAWQQAAAGIDGLNAYGVTEATVTATVHDLAGEETDRRLRVGVGRPLGGSLARILDPRGQPAPAGVAGELHLGGTGLARGYHRRPQPTAASFVPDPFAGEPGARLYRTGDLARWRADGVIEVLGRLDRQLKVRGFRLEPAEIEIALEAHPAVTEAAVLNDGGAGRLAAYVAAGAPRPSAGALRRWLERRFPSFMVPATFTVLDRLPRTAGGKVDRAALPPAGDPRPAAEPAYAAPRTELERELAGIWSEVLGVERVGLDDSFWELGGHSLLAARMLARVQERLGLDLPLAALFAAPTLLELTAALGQSLLDGGGGPEGAEGMP